MWEVINPYKVVCIVKADQGMGSVKKNFSAPSAHLLM